MKLNKMISVIDTHTAGEAARLVTAGVPKIPGKDIVEKKQYLIDNLDDLRKSVMFEPRGHQDMFGAFLLPPTKEEADFALIFMDTGGYLNMCGHNTIAAVTAAVETGMVDVEEGATEKEVVVETPAGLIYATAKLKDNGAKVKEVSFKNVESFLYKRDLELDVEGVGHIKFDISFGGSFFCILSADQLGLEVKPENASKLKEAGLKIRDAVNANVEIQHPTLSHIKSVDLVEIYDKPSHPEATYKNVVVFGDGNIDRSPCGTGTSAKLATLYAKGELKPGEPFVYESILGTLFKGRIVEERKLADFDAIIPEITGSGYILGFSNYVYDPDDALTYGFLLG
ncbi:proline racemase family protein [Gemella sanguinis]|jgi:proline racemase|uniref:proline racemase family protein n=1 Tax=Gemella sanguinis TaxID=84135 RepID=UPI0026EEDE50|nr:proline racemase family protein [Gemella sanguinis]